MVTPTDLEALRERVRVATGPLDWQDAVRLALLNHRYVGSLEGPHRGDDGGDEYSARVTTGDDVPRTIYPPERNLPDRSLDAALGLVERMLPGEVELYLGGDTLACGVVYGHAGAYFKAKHKRIEMALLDALLSALIAQQADA